MKFKINANVRGNIRLSTTTVSKANLSPPVGWSNLIFKLAKGDDNLPMRGAIYSPPSNYTPDPGPIEYTHDLTKKLTSGTHIGKVFLCGQNYNTPNQDDKILSYSLVNYRWNEVFEIECEQQDASKARKFWIQECMLQGCTFIYQKKTKIYQASL